MGGFFRTHPNWMLEREVRPKDDLIHRPEATREFANGLKPWWGIIDNNERTWLWLCNRCANHFLVPKLLKELANGKM